MNTPLASLQSELGDRTILVTNPLNIAYLTGFRGISPEEREVFAYVTSKTATLILPRMYESAAQRLPAVTSGSVQLDIDQERDGLLTRFGKLTPPNQPVLIEDRDLRVAEQALIKKKLKLRLAPAGGLIEDLRTRKSAEELTSIRRAVELTDQTFGELVSYLRSTDYSQLTELDLADKVWQIARSLGGEGLSFTTVAAVGVGSAEPHYATGHQKLRSGNALLLDFGVTYGGYLGDLTRCAYLGKAPKKFRETYAIVLEANRRGLEACKPGISTDQLHAVATDYFAEHGLENYFLHALGHGVGLEIHENPKIGPAQQIKLEPGMIITIEPGLYLSGEFGIRIEDYVHITDDGCEVLSSSPKELIEL